MAKMTKIELSDYEAPEVNGNRLFDIEFRPTKGNATIIVCYDEDNDLAVYEVECHLSEKSETAMACKGLPNCKHCKDGKLRGSIVAVPCLYTGLFGKHNYECKNQPCVFRMNTNSVHHKGFIECLKLGFNVVDWNENTESWSSREMTDEEKKLLDYRSAQIGVKYSKFETKWCGGE